MKINRCVCGKMPTLGMSAESGLYSVVCDNNIGGCGLCGGFSSKTEVEAIEKWNSITFEEVHTFCEKAKESASPKSIMERLEEKQKKQNAELQELAKLKAFYYLKISSIDVRVNLLVHEASRDGASLLKIKSERGMDLTV